MKFYIFLIFIIFKISDAFAIDTKAEQAIVIDNSTNEIIFEKNSDERMSPASMTKIMTIYIVFDRLINTNLTLDDTCRISPKAYKMKGSRTFIEIDTNVSIHDLIKGVIIQSGNDASVAIAECLSGTEKDFSKLMNVYAKDLGLINSNFTNSSGWPEDNHYSTVKDIAILSFHLIKNFPDLYVFFKEKEFTYNNIKQPNRNKLLDNVFGVDGLKTGYVKKSGFGISASSIRDDRRITVVIHGTNSSRSRLNESANLINWAYEQTIQKKILNKNQVIKNVDVWLGNKPNINLIIENDVFSTLSYDQLKTIKSTLHYEKPISAPFNKGDKLGEIVISIDGKPDITVPLLAETKVNPVNPFFRLIAAIKYIIFGNSLDEI